MKARSGFTLIEVLIAAIILGLGLGSILVSMSQAQKLMIYSTYYETSQEVMDIGDMAYPLEDVDDIDDLEVRETKATELWEKISEERLTSEQYEKYRHYTWERECLNIHDNDDDIKRIGNLYILRVTVKWGDRHTGDVDSESYITFWRKKE